MKVLYYKGIILWRYHTIKVSYYLYYWINWDFRIWSKIGSIQSNGSRDYLFWIVCPQLNIHCISLHIIVYTLYTYTTYTHLLIGIQYTSIVRLLFFFVTFNYIRSWKALITFITFPLFEQLITCYINIYTFTSWMCIDLMKRTCHVSKWW